MSGVEKASLRIAFLGTPEFALPSFRMLLEEGYPVAAAFTQPDRPKGRGHKLVPPPVKALAQEAGIPVYQFEKLSRDGLDALREVAPNLLITAAFGQILSREVLALPRYGCINVHGSLLPAYRGAAPIEMAILNGETRTGITTMYTVLALDAGDILEQDELSIGPDETGGQLRERMAQLGAATLSRTLAKLCAGTLAPRAQDEAAATYYPMFKKGFGAVDLSQDAQRVKDFIRALNPAPGAYLRLGEAKVKLLAAQTAPGKGAPGAVLAADPRAGLVIACGNGAVEITCLQAPGKKAMPARDFLRGNGTLFVPGQIIPSEGEG